ncbi:MAG: sensor histidine kinase [Mucilaginibacter sp.]
MVKKPVVHVLFWIALFFIWNRVVYFYVTNSLNRLYFTAQDVSLVIIAFYVVFGFLMPVYFNRKRMGLFVTGLLLAVVVLTGLHTVMSWYFLRHNLVPIHFDFLWTYSDLQYNRLFIAMLGTLAGCVCKLAIDRIESDKKLVMMEKEKAAAELTYLKAQINPHFLFNSLNSVYAQLEAESPDTKQTVIALADLLRYQLYDCNIELISLDKEIEYLRNYFMLQRIRHDNCRLDFVSEGDTAGLKIAPLILIPFVENAFKYVSDFDEQENFISIKIDTGKDVLNFSCVNSVMKRNNTTQENGGIGLSNVYKRLQLLYHNRFNLQNGFVGDSYSVRLNLKLNGT